MMVPKHLQRHPTRAAIEALALRFGLPNDPSMQDWEWEVADAGRLDAFIAAYRSGELDDDERFTLMEVIIQSFEDEGTAVDDDPRWPLVARLLDENIALHAQTVWYWACLGSDDEWCVTPLIRPILEKHHAQLLGSDQAALK